MKKCERCGASNAERARFCSHCAEPFATANDSRSDSPVPVQTLVAQAEKTPPVAPLPATFADVDDRAPNSAARVESNEDFYRALATICATLARVFVFLFGRLFAFLKRCALGIWSATRSTRSRFLLAALQLGRDALRSFALVFTPSTRWSETAPPNFLLPSLVFFFLWTRPCALVAVVYSILANEARHANDEIAALRRAVAARNWIFLELLCVALKAAFEAFGMTLPILQKLFF